MSLLIPRTLRALKGAKICVPSWYEGNLAASSVAEQNIGSVNLDLKETIANKVT